MSSLSWRALVRTRPISKDVRLIRRRAPNRQMNSSITAPGRSANPKVSVPRITSGLPIRGLGDTRPLWGVIIGLEADEAEVRGESGEVAGVAGEHRLAGVPRADGDVGVGNVGGAGF